MPITFLSHQAIVLPLKLARPRRLDATALVLGSMAPDFESFLRGTPSRAFGHSVLGQFYFCLPITLALYLLVTRVIARPLAAHLPDFGRFHLRDYAVVGDWRARGTAWGTVVACALVGSFSHIIWDSFTHDDGWPVLHLAVLRTPIYEVARRPALLFEMLQHVSTITGAAATLLLLRYIGERRLVLRWAENAGAPPAAPVPRRWWFWVVVVAISALGVAWGVAESRFPAPGWGRRELAAKVLYRGTVLAFLALCVACAAVGRDAPDPPRRQAR